MFELKNSLQIKSSSDPKALQNLVQELQNAENEGRIEVIESTCAWDEVGGPDTGLPWYHDLLDFTIRDVTDNNLYILAADTYHGRWYFHRLNRHDIEYILRATMKQDGIECEYNKLSIGEYSEEYDTLGCFQKNDSWYAFWTDERNDITITGPLSDTGVMYVMIQHLYIKSLYQKYRLSEEDEQRYLYCFYKSIDEIDEPLVESQNVFLELDKTIINGTKVPHSMSRPVIRKEEGVYYLAVFVFYYNRTDVESGAVNRPTLWAIADIKTGNILKRYDTKNKDFSGAPYDVKYNIRSDTQYDTSKSYYEKAFGILDSVRTKIIKEGVFDKEAYRKYLDMILKNIPEAYQRFYTDLSI